MMVLTKKRVAVLDALNERFGDPEKITRAQITIALDEKVITAWPYWLTDDLTLKVDRGVWMIPTPDNFVVAEKGQKATKPSTFRAMVAEGKTPPVFLKEKPVVSEKPVKVAKVTKKAPKMTAEPATVQMEVPKAPKQRKPKAPKVDMFVPAETASETVSPTV